MRAGIDPDQCPVDRQQRAAIKIRTQRDHSPDPAARVACRAVQQAQDVPASEDDPSTIELVSQTVLARVGANAGNGRMKLPTVVELCARREAAVNQERLL